MSILRRHLMAARSSPLIPIPASLYADIAQGFFAAEIVEIGETAWRIASRGQMQTVRFDDIGSRTVDVQGSRGVLGYSRHGPALYVAGLGRRAKSHAVDVEARTLEELRDGPGLR